MAEFVISVTIGLIGICLSLLVFSISPILTLILPVVTAIGIFCFILSRGIYKQEEEDEQ